MPPSGPEAVSERRALATLLAVVISELIVSAAFIAVFASRFPPAGRRLQFFHVALVAALLFVTVVILGLLMRAHRMTERRWQRAAAGMLGAAWALLLLLYAADLISNRLWRENVHVDRLIAYGQWILGLDSGVRPFSLLAYASVAAAIVSVSGCFVLLSDRLFLAVGTLFLAGGRYSLFRDASRSRKSLGALCICGLAVLAGISWLARRLVNDGLLHRDPIVGFFRPQSQRGQFGWYLTFEAQQRRVAQERAAYRQLNQSANRNVVIIIVDSLRADHLPLYGYQRQTTPFLSRLFSEGRLRKVDLAISSCALSPCGILSTMSGKYVPQVQAGFKIFDLLHDLGYRLFFLLGGHHEEDGLRLAYGTEQTVYLDASHRGAHGAQDDQYVLEGLEQLPRNANDKAFFYFHLMSAHWAGTKWPQYARFVPDGAELGLGTIFRGSAERDKWINRYDNGVLQSDAVIERIFGRLSSLGYLDRGTVFILGDHGEALGDHGPASYFHGDIFYQEVIHIPLLIYDDPGVVYRNLEFASQIDVAPTIADRLNLAIPKAWRGVSLLKPAGERAITTGDADCGATLYRHDGRLDKYLRCNASHVEGLYDLRRDPAEAQNLLGEAEPQLLQILQGALEHGGLPSD